MFFEENVLITEYSVSEGIYDIQFSKNGSLRWISSIFDDRTVNVTFELVASSPIDDFVGVSGEESSGDFALMNYGFLFSEGINLSSDWLKSIDSVA